MCKSALLVLLGVSVGLGKSFPSQEPDGGKHWVVIVAGSNGWFNYRHQVRRSVTTMLIQTDKMHHWPQFLDFSSRRMHVMRTKLSTGMGSQMSRLWLWCMMTWQKMICKLIYFVLLVCIICFILQQPSTICLFQVCKKKDASMAVWERWRWKWAVISRSEHTEGFHTNTQMLVCVCVCVICTGSAGYRIESTLGKPAERSHEELVVVCVYVSLSLVCCLQVLGAKRESLFFHCCSSY